MVMGHSPVRTPWLNWGSAAGIALLPPLLSWLSQGSRAGSSPGWSSVGIASGTGTAVLARLERAAGKQGEEGPSPAHPRTGNHPTSEQRKEKGTQRGAARTAHTLGTAQLEHWGWHSWNSCTGTAQLLSPGSPRQGQLLTAPQHSSNNHFPCVKAPFPAGSSASSAPPGSVTLCCARDSTSNGLPSWAWGLASRSPSLQRFCFLLYKLLSCSRGSALSEEPQP